MLNVLEIADTLGYFGGIMTSPILCTMELEYREYKGIVSWYSAFYLAGKDCLPTLAILKDNKMVYHQELDKHIQGSSIFYKWVEDHT